MAKNLKTAVQSAKSEAGRALDGQPYDEFPEPRQIAVPDLEFRRNALEQLEAELV